MPTRFIEWVSMPETETATSRMRGRGGKAGIPTRKHEADEGHEGMEFHEGQKRSRVQIGPMGRGLLDRLTAC